MAYHLLTEDPVPIWHLEEGHRPDFTDEPIVALDRRQGWIAFRGVPIEHLGAVVATGVDKDPTDSTIFCADEDKAYEYARPRSGMDGPGLMYALRGGHLERSFRTLPADAPPEQVAEVQATYPHRYENLDGTRHFSRLADQANTAYEMAYGYWIPGDAREALLAIFLLGSRDAFAEALRTLNTKLSQRISMVGRGNDGACQ